MRSIFLILVITTAAIGQEYRPDMPRPKDAPPPKDAAKPIEPKDIKELLTDYNGWAKKVKGASDETRRQVIQDYQADMAKNWPNGTPMIATGILEDPRRSPAPKQSVPVAAYMAGKRTVIINDTICEGTGKLFDEGFILPKGKSVQKIKQPTGKVKGLLLWAGGADSKVPTTAACCLGRFHLIGCRPVPDTEAKLEKVKPKLEIRPDIDAILNGTKNP